MALWVDFDELKVTTMTLVVILDGDVNLTTIHYLLELTPTMIPCNGRKSKKKKLPRGEPGSVFYSRYLDSTRGTFFGGSRNIFKNSITLELSTDVKNLNMKLSSKKVQMCGAASVENGKQGVNLLIAKIKDIQSDLDYISEHIEEANTVVEWIEENTKGEEIEIEVNDEELQTKELQTEIEESPIEKEIIISIKNPSEIPEHIDQRIAHFLLKQIRHYDDHTIYNQFTRWAISQRRAILSEDLKIGEIKKAMVNYNYDLGFEVDRSALARQINGLNGFFSQYANSVVRTVTIKLPYNVPPEEEEMRKKNKTPCHTFLVYRSGKVTQSGPNEEANKIAFYRFIETIKSILNKISRSGSTVKFCYTPHYRDSPSTDSSETVSPEYENYMSESDPRPLEYEIYMTESDLNPLEFKSTPELFKNNILESNSPVYFTEQDSDTLKLSADMFMNNYLDGNRMINDISELPVIGCPVQI